MGRYRPSADLLPRHRRLPRGGAARVAPRDRSARARAQARHAAQREEGHALPRFPHYEAS